MYWAPLYWLILLGIASTDHSLDKAPPDQDPAAPAAPTRPRVVTGQPAWSNYFPSPSSDPSDAVDRFRSGGALNDNNDPASPSMPYDTAVRPAFTPTEVQPHPGMIDQASSVGYDRSRVPDVFRSSQPQPAYNRNYGLYDRGNIPFPADARRVTTRPPPSSWMAQPHRSLRTTWKPFIKISNPIDYVAGRDGASPRTPYTNPTPNQQVNGPPVLTFPYLDEQEPESSTSGPAAPTTEDGQFRYDPQQQTRISEARSQLQQFFAVRTSTPRPPSGIPDRLLPFQPSWTRQGGRQMEPDSAVPSSSAAAAASQLQPDTASPFAPFQVQPNSAFAFPEYPPVRSGSPIRSGSPVSSGSPVWSGSPVSSGSPVWSSSPVWSGSPAAATTEQYLDMEASEDQGSGPSGPSGPPPPPLPPPLPPPPGEDCAEEGNPRMPRKEGGSH